jgi:WD40 repeat protein
MRYLLQIILIILSVAIVTETAAQKPDIVVQSGHHQAIFALAISPDKRLLASGGTDNVIIIWDIAQGKQLYSLKEHSQWVFSLSFSSNGLLASGSADGFVRVWDVSRGVKVDEFSIQPQGVTCVAFSPDGSMLAISGNGPVIRIRDLAAKTMKPDLKGHRKAVHQIIFTPDNKSLISHSEDETLRLWDLATGKSDFLTVFPKKATDLMDLGISPDGNLALLTSENKAIFWNLRTKEETAAIFPITEKKKYSEDIKGFVFFSNEVLACQFTEEVLLWNFKTGELTPVGTGFVNISSSMAISSDHKVMAYSYDENISIYDTVSKQTKRLSGNYEALFEAINLDFGPDGHSLFAVGRLPYAFGFSTEIDVSEGLKVAAKLWGPRNAYISSINSMANFGGIRGEGSSDITLKKDPTGQRTMSVVKAHDKSIRALSVNEDGTLLASCSEDGTIKIWDVGNWAEPKKILQEPARDILFSPDGKWLLSSGNDVGIKIWDTATWEGHSISTTTKGTFGQSGFGQLRFSPDSTMMAAVATKDAINQDLLVWNVHDRSLLRSFELEQFPPDSKIFAIFSLPFPGKSLSMALFDHTAFTKSWGSLSFSRNSSMVACQYTDYVTGLQSLKVWNVRTGKEIHNLIGHPGSIRSTGFSYKDKILASSSVDNTIKLWSVKTGEELATIVLLMDGKWIIYTPEGRFDTNTDLEDDELIHWAIPGNALNTLPLDVFMRDYYEPKLFEHLLNCVKKDTCDEEFRQTRNLSELNVVRPEVKITGVSLPDANRMVNVSIEISRAAGLVEQGNGQQITRTTDVYDLRLFRDKQLAGVAPFDGAGRIERRKTEIENSELKSRFETELKIWKESTKVKLNPRTGKQTVSFNVQLPKGRDASDVKFAAYAFNEDRVKSETSKYEWTTEQKAKLPKADPDLKRRAYVFSIGVNDSRLIYSERDANKFQKEVPEQLRQTGIYEVVPIKLVTAYGNGGTVENANKLNIKTVFELLAGKDVRPEIKRRIPNYQQIKKSTPDDLIIFTYSGHGYSGKNSDFYLLLSDPNDESKQVMSDPNMLISGEELALWLRDIEMNEMALIIDACQSAAAVESLDFKPGPLGSRGFGQLAYDKRLRVLVAAQADNGAIQADGEIKGGLLTYALIDEGLIGGSADAESNKDGKISLDEWLKYGESRVPGLFKQANKQEVIAAGVKKKLVWKKIDVDTDFDVEQETVLQRASFFNFSRQNSDILLFNVNPGGKN